MKADELRRGLKSRSITHEKCLEDAGYFEEWIEARRHAEIAVAAYLQQPLPAEYIEKVDLDDGKEDYAGTIDDGSITVEGLDLKPATDCVQESDGDTHPLLDVLPDRFEYEAKMMYGNFAHADYREIRSMDGKQQAARLRQLADLFDTTGKIIFYYYAYPHVWKQLRPPEVDKTVATVVHDRWNHLLSDEKEFWRTHSARLKRYLGDGNVEGLVWLELDSMDEDVLQLHEEMRRLVG